MLSVSNVHKLDMMSIVDEALLTSRYKAQFHTRDGTVLPPTMTSRRYRQASMSVVDMSLVVEDMDQSLITPRHQRCYDEHVSAWRRVKRSRRRRRRGSGGGDDVEPMDTGDHTHAHHHVTGDVREQRLESGRVARRSRLISDNDAVTPQTKWKSSRYLQTHADRQRRRAEAKSRQHTRHRHHHHHHHHQQQQQQQRHHDSPSSSDVSRPAASTPVVMHIGVLQLGA